MRGDDAPINARPKWRDVLNAPTGRRPKAQGCEARATLGEHGLICFPTPTGLRPFPSAPQPRWGCFDLFDREPKVAALPQPWAGGHSPVGAGNGGAA